MKTKLILVLLVAAGVTVAGAQTQVAHPSTPAPAIMMTSPAPSRVIYTPRLPSTTELSDVAVAQNLDIQRIDQTDSQITVIYKNSNGQLSTVAYRVLGSSGAPAVASTTTVVTTPAPTVVYQDADPFLYYDDPYYYPWGYYNPVSLSLGFGFYRGFGGYRGGYHGGFHHGGFHGGHRR